MKCELCYDCLSGRDCEVARLAEESANDFFDKKDEGATVLFIGNDELRGDRLKGYWLVYNQLRPQVLEARKNRAREEHEEKTRPVVVDIDNESFVEDESLVVIDIKEIYGETAKLAMLSEYEAAAVKLAGNGQDVTITGAGPVWLYLRIAHALHGKCRSLSYDSPVTGQVVVFDHNPK